MDHHDETQKYVLEVPISAEELKIRNELAMKIERDLEEEIKEGIYNLARRLNRIRAFSEVIIRMKIEGGNKIEIKEVNKETNERGCSFRPNFRSKICLKEVKNIDWEKSLRTSSSPVCVRGSYVGSKHKDGIMMKGKNGSVDKKLLHLGWKV